MSSMSNLSSRSRSISKYYSSSERGSLTSTDILRKSQKSDFRYNPSLGSRRKSIQENEFLQKPPPKYSIKTKFQIAIVFSKLAVRIGKASRRWGKLVYQCIVAGLIFSYILISVFCRRELIMPLVATILVILISGAVLIEGAVMQNRNRLPFNKKKFKSIFETRTWKVAKICIFIVFAIGALVNAGMMIPRNNIFLVPFILSIGSIIVAFLFSFRISKVTSRSTLIGVFGQYYLTAIIFHLNVDNSFWKEIGEFFHFISRNGYQGARILLDDYVDYYEIVSYFAVLHLFHLILLTFIRTGLMRYFYYAVGTIMRFYIGLSVVEGSTAICSIFINPMVIIVLLKNYIHRMNWSELHFLMSVGNCVVPPYLWHILITKYKIPPQHIVISNFLSVLASASFSKIIFPEKYKTRVGLKALRKQTYEGPKGPITNLIIAVLSLFPLACLALAAKLLCQIFNDILISMIETFLQAYVAEIRFWELLGRPIGFVVERLGINYNEAFQFAEVVWLKFFYSDSVAFRKLDEYLNNNQYQFSHYFKVLSVYSVASIPSFATNVVSLLMLNYCCPRRMYRLSRIAKKSIISTYTSAIFKISILWIYIDPNRIDHF